MTKLIRKYQRWALAFFGVLLMLTFLGNRGNGGGTDTSEHVMGHLDGRAITRAELEDARNELNILEHSMVITDPSTYRQIPLPIAVFGNPLLNDFMEKPAFFYLLRDEARHSGVTVSSLQLDRYMAECYQGPPAESDEYTSARSALTDLLLILGRLDQMQNDIKISKPALDHALATARESVGVNFVQLQAADYALKVPPPTTQQVEDQFNKFKDMLPGTVIPGTNPFGFGYKLPVRARMQWLSIAPKSIDDAVIASGPVDVVRPAGWSLDQWWDLAGKKYYIANKDKCDALASSDATTKPLGPQLAPTYDKVRSQVLSLIRKPATEKLLSDVKSYVNATLTSGWQTYRQYKTAAPAPATEPTTALGDPFSSFAFLQDLEAQVHSKFNVTATVNDTKDAVPLPLQKTLAVLPLINPDISDFVSSQATAWLDSADRTAATAALLRPSVAMQSDAGAPISFVRVVGVLPSVAPADISSAKTAVLKDLRTAASYALARTDAEGLITAAGKGNFSIAAAQLGQFVLCTLPSAPLTLNPPRDQDIRPTSVISPPLDDEAAARFTYQSWTLLNTYDPKTNPHPAKLVELQPQGRVFAVQLKNVNADWTAEFYYKMVMQTRNGEAQQLLSRLRSSWFNYDAVVQRTGYQPAKTSG